MIRFYSKVVELDPSAADVAVQIGHALKEIGEFEAAAATYQAVLRIRPNDDDLHLQIGHLEKVAGRPASALDHYRRALDLNPANADAQREHQILVSRGGSVREISAAGMTPIFAEQGAANTAASLRLEGDSGLEVLQADGDMARDAKRWDAAAAAYGGYLRLSPDRPDIWAQYGNCLKECGQLTEAEAAYRSGLAIQSDGADLHHQLGHVLQLQGRRGEALRAYTEAFALTPLRSTFEAMRAFGGSINLETAARTRRNDSQVTYLEISDLLFVMSSQAVVSGIQRVQFGLLSHILHQGQAAQGGFEGGSRCEFAIWHEKELWSLPGDILAALVVHYNSTGGRSFERQKEIISQLEAKSVLVRPKSGDTFMSTGVVYVRPDLIVPRERLRRGGVRVGAMIYDFIPLTDPEFCSPVLTAQFSPSISELLLQIDFAVTISKYVADETERLMREGGYPAIPVRAVPLAHEFIESEAQSQPVEDIWSPAISALRDSEYVLCVSTLNAHKNHIFLLHVWRLLLREGVDLPKLVMVGRRSYGVDDLFTQLQSTNNLDGRVLVIDGPSDSEISTLYNNCLFTMFPSYVEGWGLPVGESLSKGKVCIASETTSMPEVGGDLVLYIDPYNVRAAANLVRRLLTDRGELHRREATIRKQFRPRSWSDYGRNFLAALTDVTSMGDGHPGKRTPPFQLVEGRLLRFQEAGDEMRPGAMLPSRAKLAEKLFPQVVLASGWIRLDNHSVWMSEPRARLTIPVNSPPGSVVHLIMQLRATAGARGSAVTIEARGEGHTVCSSSRDERSSFLASVDCVVDEASYIDVTISAREVSFQALGVGLVALFIESSPARTKVLPPNRLFHPTAVIGPKNSAIEPRGRTAIKAALDRRAVLINGWAEPEVWGVWMVGNGAEVQFAIEPGAGQLVRVVLQLCVTSASHGSVISASAACGGFTTKKIKQGHNPSLLLWLDIEVPSDDQVRITLELAGQRAPGAQPPFVGLESFAYGSSVDRSALTEALLFQSSDSVGDEFAFREEDLRFNITGHVNGSYSLAIVNRSLALTLDNAYPGMVRLQQVEGKPVDDLTNVPIAERNRVAAMASRPAHADGVEITISQHWPIWIPTNPGDLPLAFVFWEESLLPHEMARKLNDNFSGVLTPSQSVSKVLADSGVRLPVRVIGFAPDLRAFAEVGARRLASGPRTAVSHEKPFTFLHVSSCFPRKGVDVLLKAFTSAFRVKDPVKLIIKTFPNPHNDVQQQIEHLRTLNPELPSIVVVNCDISTEALLGMYSDADAMVLPTRGEGFNIPAAEALAAGLELIVTGYGAHMDFTKPEFTRLVRYRFASSQSHLKTAGSVWVEPDLDDLVAAMLGSFAQAQLDRYDNASRRIELGRLAAARIADATSWAARVRSNVLDLLLAGADEAPRVAWVSSWNVQCGIAEYSRMLLAAYPNAARDITVLCDERVPLPSVNTTDRQPLARSAWRGADSSSMETLATEIEAHDAPILVIQHHKALIAWPDLAKLLLDRRVVGRHIVVLLHNVNEILAADHPDCDVLIKALGSISRILVHTVGDLNLLRSRGLVSNVAIFPHGALRLEFAPRAPRPLPPESAPIIGTYGFLLPHKGFATLIEAFAHLRQRWPAARLRMVTAEYPLPISAEAAQLCRELARSLGLDQAIDWHTNYLPNETSLRLLSECDVVVMPYQETPESSSAAVRTALASRTPVMVTPISIFEDVSDAVLKLHGTDVQSIASGVSWFLQNQHARQHVREQADHWLAQHDWSILSQRLRDMVISLNINRA